MTIAQLIPLAISLSMALMVLSFGLQSSWTDAVSLLRQPGLLVRSLLAMNVVMLALALTVDFLLVLHPAVEIAIVALALSPVPPILPNKQTKAGGEASYTVSLLVIMAALSVIVVPLGIAAVNAIFGLGISVPNRIVFSVVATGIIVPLAIGLLIHQFAPGFALRLAKPLSLFAMLLLVVAFIPVIVKIWPTLTAMVGNGTLIALIIFAIVGLVVGHALGGPNPDDRTVLALASSTRHPGVALALAHSMFPEEKAVLAVLLWHLIVGTVVCLPYVKWRTRLHATEHTKVH